jgi:3-isopropylmalate/(R)-2-methylmalate dehydratase large subunit
LSAARATAAAPAARTFAQKALARAAGRDAADVGEILDVCPDVVLSHDNSAAIREIWRRFGLERVVRPERLAITLDHAVPAPTARHAQNHAEIRRFVREQGIARFFEVGRGICHQVLSEEAVVLPGQLILGADSHTPHFGWLGAFGAGIGRSEVAVLWATGSLWLRVPETLRLELEGRLRPWVSSKDLSLALLGRLGTDGALYRCVEIDGPGVGALSLDARAALANMTAELGAKSCWLPSDAAVIEYLAAALAANTGEDRDRCAELIRDGILAPDPGAPAAERHTLDLGEVEPLVACPHRPDNVHPVGELASVRVDQAFIGTCTNGRLEDIEVVHRLLRGRRVAVGTRLLIVPASSRVLADALARGWVADLIAAGAVFGTPGCGPCMGNHLGVLAPGEVCISSANRNFRGRMGTPEAEIYLASPAVVAASAVAGRIADPQEIEA